MSAIYDNVAEIAKQKKIPLCKVEKDAGLAAGAISKWKYNNPRTDSLIAVAKVLKVSVGRLIKQK